MPRATMTSKGQITVPKEVREKLHLKTGSRIDFVIEPSGRVIFQPLRSDFRSLKASIGFWWIAALRELFVPVIRSLWVLDRVHGQIDQG